MKICPRCSVRNTDEARFCEECGCNLSDVPVTRQPQPLPESKGWQGGQTGPAKGWNGGGQTSPTPPPVTRPRVTVKKPSKNLMILLAQVAVLVILLIAFVAVGNGKTDPAKVAENYFRAVAEGDWQTIRQYTDVGQSPFLTEEAFRTAYEERDLFGGKVAQISASRREEYSDTAMEDYLTYVDVEYVLEGGTRVYNATLTMVKGEGREMFFFPQWEVADYLPMVARNTRIEVPAGATLVVDGLVVDETLRYERLEGTDVYAVDLFVGQHNFQVLTDIFGQHGYNCDVWYNDEYYYCADISLSENGQNALVAQTKTLLEQFFAAALAQESFDAIAGSYTGEAVAHMEDYYSYFVEDLFGDEDWRTLSITLNDFSVWDCYAYMDDGQAYAYLDLTYTTDFEYADLWNGYLAGTDHYTDGGEIALTFVNENGSWVPSGVWTLYY